MAFNPSPRVAAARDFGDKFGSDMVIILHLNSVSGEIGYASWGKTRLLCEMAQGYANLAYEHIQKEVEE